MMVQRKTGEPVTKVKKGFYGAKGRVGRIPFSYFQKHQFLPPGCHRDLSSSCFPGEEIGPADNVRCPLDQIRFSEIVLIYWQTAEALTL